jgi:putative transcriptional regulator
LSKNKLRHYRIIKDLTQSGLASAVGVSSDYISMLERGSRTPGFALANKISFVLECSIDDLDFFSEIKEQNILS